VMFLGSKICRTPEDVKNAAVYMPASYGAEFTIQPFWISLFQIHDAPDAQIS